MNQRTDNTASSERLARWGAALAAYLLCLIPCLASESTHDHHAHAHHAMESGYARTVQRYEPPGVSLVRQSGEATFAHRELQEEGALMMNFIFTSCSAICPVMSGTFAEVQKKLGAEHKPVRLVSISIDPEYDTPGRLHDYAARFSSADNWHFLTGERQAILEVQKAFNAYRGNKMNHTPLTFMRASPAAPWIRIEGFASADDLIREYHALPVK